MKKTNQNITQGTISIHDGLVFLQLFWARPNINCRSRCSTFQVMLLRSLNTKTSANKPVHVWANIWSVLRAHMMSIQLTETDLAYILNLLGIYYMKDLYDTQDLGIWTALQLLKFFDWAERLECKLYASSEHYIHWKVLQSAWRLWQSIQIQMISYKIEQERVVSLVITSSIKLDWLLRWGPNAWMKLEQAKQP